MSHKLFRVAGTAASRPLFARSLSTRADLKWEEKIMSALSQVRDPVTNRSIRALGYIQSISPSAVQVELPSPFHPNRLELVKDMTARLQEVADPAPKMKVSYAERGHDANSDAAPLRGPGLEHVQRIISLDEDVGSSSEAAIDDLQKQIIMLRAAEEARDPRRPAGPATASGRSSADSGLAPR